MPTCRICAVMKPIEEFQKIFQFVKYKRHNPIWCKDCQKMFIQMKKEEAFLEKYVQPKEEIVVSFD